MAVESPLAGPTTWIGKKQKLYRIRNNRNDKGTRRIASFAQSFWLHNHIALPKLCRGNNYSADCMLENENDWLKCLSFLLVTDPVRSAHVIIHSCTFSGYIIKVLVLIINSADIPLSCFTVLWYLQPLRIPLPVVAHCIRVFYICRILAKGSNKMLPDHLKYIRLFKYCYVPHFVWFYLTCFTELWVQVNKSIAFD